MPSFSLIRARANDSISADINFSYEMEPEGYSDSSWLYHYENQDYGNEKLIGAYYSEDYYTYIYNENDIIVGIQDFAGSQIVKYTYDQYGILTGVFSNEDGEWIENNNPDFIGNENKMLLSGMFFDKNTNCYYVNQRYYNPVLNKYMDGINNEDIFVDKNPYSMTGAGDIKMYASDDSDLAATEWAEQLLASSSYGVPISSFSSSWYSKLSDVEIVARAIYCEGGTAYTDEDSAVAWVILNRINSTGFQSTAAAAVVKAKGQFASITGGSGPTRDARIPTTNSSRWEHSTFLACLLLTTTSNSEWSTIIGNKINGQLYFYSYTVAKSNSVFTGTTSSTLKYNGTAIKNVYVLDYGNVTSFSTLFNNYSPINYSRNIYYDIK